MEIITVNFLYVRNDIIVEVKLKSLYYAIFSALTLRQNYP